MSKRLLIIGAGGHGQAVADLAELSSEWCLIEFVDDRFPEKVTALNYKIVGDVASLFDREISYDGYVVAIGNNKVRMEVIEKLTKLLYPMVSLIHPYAWVSKYAKISHGSVVMAGAVIGTNAALGSGVIINANATVDHDCILGDGAHLGVGVSLAGGVKVGKQAWIQAGSNAGYNVAVKDFEVFLPGSVLKPDQL